MARIRSIKPEFWDDRKLAKRTSRDARLLYVALWNLADEHARLNGDPQWIKGQAFSYDDDLDATAIAKLLEELESPAVGAIVAYEVDGDPYLYLPKLARHQRLEPEKVKSRLPAPPIASALDPDEFPPPDGSSGRRADESACGSDQSERHADSSARDADESEPHAEQPALLYVAGSREHVGGVQGGDAAQAPPDKPPRNRRATRIPDDFAVTPDMAEWARENVPELIRRARGKRETEKFVNYWQAKSGRDATKHDWVATWRNWMLKAEEDLEPGRPGNGAKPPTDHRREWERNRG